MTIKMKALLFAFLLFSLIPQVYAQDQQPSNEQINLLEIPSRLAKALGIPEFAGQLLTCALVMLIILLPIAIFSKGNMLLSLIVGFILLGFFVAVGWMPYWFMLIIVLIVSALWSSKIGGWLTR